MGRKPTGLFRRHGTYVGLFIKGAVLSNNLKFSGQVPVLPDDRRRKVLAAVAPQEPSITLDCALFVLGKVLPVENQRQGPRLVLYLSQVLGSCSPLRLQLKARRRCA